MLLVAEFLERIGADVVVGDDQTSRGNERAATTGVETHASFLQMVEPRTRRLEMISFFELLERRRIEEPHPFVGKRGCAQSNRESKN